MKKSLATMVLFTVLILGCCFYIVWDAFIKSDDVEEKKNLPNITNYEIEMTCNMEAEGVSQTRGSHRAALGDGPANLEEAQQAVCLYAAQNGLSIQYYPEDLIARIVSNPELENFVLNYPLGKADMSSSEISITRDISLAGGGVPFFLQWDERWGYTTYGSDLMGLTGCGPTALSMVLVYLTNDNSLNPLRIAEFAMENGYYDYENSTGTFWSLMTTGAESFGVTSNEMTCDSESLIASLEQGHPVIAIMGPGDFTTEGHFIVITSYKDGFVTVNDPNSIIRSETTWSVEDIVNQANGMWEYSYYG